MPAGLLSNRLPDVISNEVFVTLYRTGNEMCIV